MTTELATIEQFKSELALLAGETRFTLEYDQLTDSIKLTASDERYRKFFGTAAGCFLHIGVITGDAVGLTIMGASWELKQHKKQLGEFVARTFKEIASRSIGAAMPSPPPAKPARRSQRAGSGITSSSVKSVSSAGSSKRLRRGSSGPKALA
jgi:hypothetical protein